MKATAGSSSNEVKTFEAMGSRGQLRRLGRLAHKALSKYPIDVERLAPLKHEHNTTFRVWTTDHQRYVLRIHRPGQHTAEAIESELLWLTALHQDTDLEIPLPILTKDGDHLTTASDEGVPEPRVCVLFRWLEGRFLDRQLTPGHMERTGMFIAHLHEHASHWRRPPHFTRGRVDVLTAEARRASRVHLPTATPAELAHHPTDADAERCLSLVNELGSPEGGAVVTRAIGKIRQVLQALGFTSNTFGLIHADLHQENYFFHRGRVRAIDFDDCGFGHYLFDLNVTLIEVQRHPRYGALRESLLAGYRKVRSLPAAHEAYLNTFFALRYLQLLVWVLESREHPAFRDEWRRWAKTELQQLEQCLGDS